MIKIPIEIGDTILTGKFRNHQVEVKEIGKDEWGHPTVNGKPILKVRIQKLMKKETNIKRLAKQILADAGSGKTLDAIDKLITEYDDYHVFFDGLIEYFNLKIYDETNKEDHEVTEKNLERVAIFSKLKELMKTAKSEAMKIEG